MTPHPDADELGRMPGGGLVRPAAVLVLAALVVALIGAPAALALRYDRHAILSGEVWRLLTGHLVHLGWAHLALNAAALGCIAALLGELHHVLRWAWLAIASALGVSLGLLLASPQVAWYVGLSGISHGLVAAAALTLARRRDGAGWIWLALLVGKLVWERFQGPVPGSQAIIGGATVIDAHLYGAVAGLAGSLIPWATRP
jgi:rhomboid family GlyGly-CTERM serine protease